MQSPPRADPPYVPIRRTAWPVRRTPRWWFAAGAAIVVAGVLVGIAVHPSKAQRAADLNGFLADMKTDIQSCAGGAHRAALDRGGRRARPWHRDPHRHLRLRQLLPRQQRAARRPGRIPGPGVAVLV